ncbi:CLUMA_CG016038, isoform A [Clunio marinus]|uniref:CLUMA_CG016038, isoform A n=1 Tax=Clunio marinus TaxID=568069 RepID=A0A1J1IRJ6_9DIPT|nr:CLUMA_CG016038, isoform A [Clunio marinus]
MKGKSLFHSFLFIILHPSTAFLKIRRNEEKIFLWNPTHATRHNRSSNGKCAFHRASKAIDLSPQVDFPVSQ